MNTIVLDSDTLKVAGKFRIVRDLGDGAFEVELLEGDLEICDNEQDLVQRMFPVRFSDN